MHSTRASIRLWQCIKPPLSLKCAYATTPYSTPATHPSRITEADITAAQTYCTNLVQKFDSPSYTLQTFIPRRTLPFYFALRALNIELSRIPDITSSPTIASLRFQFWRDNIARTLSGSPPSEPVAILLHHALTLLRANNSSVTTTTIKSWLLKLISTREAHASNPPYPTLAALEIYAENTHSTLLYLSLAALPLHSLAADHLASHIGKAAGIAAILRGLPLIAFPGPPSHHSNSSASASPLPTARQGAVLLPLDVMARAGVQEEAVLREAGAAAGLRDAVFEVATRANDHLITAREMVRSLKAGDGVGHAFEHEGEEGHLYGEPEGGKGVDVQALETGFGVLMQAVATRLWLERLEKADFDVFNQGLRAREWRLPWKAYWAFRRKEF